MKLEIYRHTDEPEIIENICGLFLDDRKEKEGQLTYCKKNKEENDRPYDYLAGNWVMVILTNS